MSVINLPLMKGDRASKNAKYLSALPVNMYPIPHQTESASGYLRSFPGIEHYYDCDGVSRGAMYNSLEKSEYRVLGRQLYKDGQSVATVGGTNITSICHSPYSTAFVDQGKLKYFRDGQVTELQNWSEGEFFTTFPDWIFTPNFNGTGFIFMPRWKPSGGMLVTISFYLESVPSSDQFLIGSNRDLDANYSGVFIRADGKICYRLSNADIEVQDAVTGDNTVQINPDLPFLYDIELIGAVKRTGVIESHFDSGEITQVKMYDYSDPSTYRVYDLNTTVPRNDDGTKPDSPEEKIITNTQDDSGATDAELRGEWTDYHEQGQPFKSDATSYDLGGVIDADRFEGRYVWINKQLIGVTALVGGDDDTSPEQRPDYYAPFYKAESNPDDNLAIKSWKGAYVAVFGRSTTQFFSLTGDANLILRPRKEMQVQAGIVSTHAVCRYAGAFAALGSPKDETLQVMLIGAGTYQKISSELIDVKLSKYKESELENVVLESFEYESRVFLIMHLPNETYIYDSTQNMWSQLATGMSEGAYTGMHIIYNQEEGLTIADRFTNRVGKLNDEISSQYNALTEHILYTPVVQLNNSRGVSRIFDLSFNSVFGFSEKAQCVKLSPTLNGGINYVPEVETKYNQPMEYANKVLMPVVGACEKSIGFKMRVISESPVNLSAFSMRVSNGQ